MSKPEDNDDSDNCTDSDAEFEARNRPIAPAHISINDEIRKIEAQTRLEAIVVEKLKLELEAAPIKKFELEKLNLEFEIMKWKKANGVPL